MVLLLHMPWALNRQPVTYLGVSHRVPEMPRVPSGSVSHSLASSWSHLGSQGDSFTCDQVRNNPSRPGPCFLLEKPNFWTFWSLLLGLCPSLVSPHVPHNCCLSPGRRISTSHLFPPLSSPLPPFVGFLSPLPVSLFVKLGFLFIFSYSLSSC